MTSRWGSKLVRAIVFLVVLGATVLVALVSAPGIKSQWYYLLALIVASAVPAAGAQSAVGKWLSRRAGDHQHELVRQQEHRRDGNVNAALQAGLGQVLSRTGLPPHETGVCAYRVQRPSRRGKEMVRVAQCRLSAPHEPSGIRWTKGKGVIGACWKAKRFAVVDLTELVDAILARSPGAQVSKGQRLGFNDHELNIVRSRGVEAAEPIFDKDGRVFGCVAFEAPAGSARVLEASAVRDELAAVARAVWIAYTDT
jgi:hypothetical protein